MRSLRAIAVSLLLVLVLGPVATSGCADTVKITQRNLQDTARRLYFEAMDELVSGNYVRARQLFGEVARSPRYVRYSALARLRIGDAFYLQERFEEAIEVYRSFVAQYQSDANIPYAQFRIASAYHARIPSGWFLTPPDYEMDLTMTREAVRELERFIRTFPTSRFADVARRKLGEARKMLFEHVVYAADFYDSRDQPRAVAWRLEQAVTEYPEFAVEPELVWRMATRYADAGDSADAARAYGLYLEKFPEGDEAGEAKRRLEAIRKALQTPSSGDAGANTKTDGEAADR